MISEQAISADTQCALLLVAPLGKRNKDAPLSLTTSEYAEVVTALHAEGLRPSDLLKSDSANLIHALLARFPEKMRNKIPFERVARLLERGGQLALALSRWTAAGIWVASRADDTYPARYKRKLGRTAPPIVYGAGPTALLERGGLAVVGSRQPDEESERYTRYVGEWAASANIQVVSGAARGVDEGSMLACVDAGGTALGVVAESLMKLSTRREFREAILNGSLLLISSFDPDAGFSVPNAMARNRWIYALADRALVVACSEGRGGTWTGALEALRHGITVYVRTGNPARPGNEALVERGAIPAPADLSVLWTADAPVARLQSAPLSTMPNIEDVYGLVAPALLRLLQRPMSAKQFAAAAGLTKSQADVWLARLVVEGRIEKVKSSFQVSIGSREQTALFESK